MKTILYNPKTKDCTATQSEPGSTRWENLKKLGYIPVGSVKGMNVVVSAYKK